MTCNKLASCVISADGVACTGGCAAAGNGPSAAPEQPTIAVDSVPAAEEGGFYVAAADGFFKQQGLTVKVKSVTGGEEGIPDLQSGKAQQQYGADAELRRASNATFEFGLTPGLKQPYQMSAMTGS